MFQSKKKQTKNGRARINYESRKASTSSYYRPKERPAPKPVKDNTSAKRRLSSISGAINHVIIITIIGLVLYSTTLSTSVTIRLKDSDFKYRTQNEYSQAAEEILKKSITNRSKLLFRSAILENSIAEKFPEITNVEAITPLAGRKISLSIRVSEPLARVNNGIEQGVLDSSGVLVSIGKSEDSLVNVRFSSPQSNFNVGSRLITTDETYLISQLMREVGGLSLSNLKNFDVSEILFSVADGQFEVRYKGIEFFVKLSTYSNPDEQVGALIATLKQLDREGTLPAKYIDVRVPGRVFVL